MATIETSGGCEFQTIVQKKVFEATYDNNLIIIQPKTVGVNGQIRDPRPLTKNEFHKVWKIAEKLSKQEVFRRKNYQESFHGSYILAMIKTILDGKEIE